MNKQIIKYKHDDYLKKYIEYSNSLLRPWKKIYLYERLYDIYRCILIDKNDDKHEAIDSINYIRNNAYNSYEKLDKELNYFGYDRNTNRERIMYKSIWEECDKALKLINDE